MLTLAGQPLEPFGTWLMAQKGRGDWIDGIAAVARQDPLFPKAGDFEAVRKRMEEKGADGDALEALESAEMHWLTQ